MLWLAREFILGIHIFLAMIWVGGILFVGWGVFPAVKVLHFQSQQKFLYSLMKWSHHLFTLSGAAVILTGILLATILGPVKSWDILLHSPYGKRFFLALIIGILTLLWGSLVSYRFSMKVLSNTVLWEMADDGMESFLKSSLRNVTVISGIEVVGFISLLAIMISF